jgi:peptidoglycan/xylan/chitin deacetylase (PgdA/CDA1 family)
MLYLIRTPGFVQHLFPSLIWRGETAAKELFLTFDDGPVPEVTPWVLDLLNEFNAHATFFCVGENVSRNPEIFERIKREGHAVGNHTYSHISGWKHDPEAYLENVSSCARLVESDLFRPPYGRICRKQARELRDHNFRIVMWDVLSGDFDRDLDAGQCYQNVVDNARPGSIIVFHDSIKAQKNLRDALPRVLQYYTQLGYEFRPLETSAVTERTAVLRQTA